MEKILVIILMSFFCEISIMAQILQPKEAAVIEIVYNKAVSIDTIGGNSFRETPMILRAGETSSMFYPEKRMFIDSLNYYHNNAGLDLIANAMMRGEPTSNVTGWEDEFLFRNMRDNETMVTRHFATYHLGYIESTEFPNWTIDTSRTKQILGYDCIYATCTYRGREWKVWFAPSIPLKEGPWKLAGLPGMVLWASDKGGQYFYTAESIKTRSIPDVGIYIYHRRNLDMMKNRQDYLRATYHLVLKRKFLNEVSVYTDFKMSIKDEVPLYDLEETDFIH